MTASLKRGARGLRRLVRRLTRIGRSGSTGRRRWLLETLPKASVGAEVGVWRGDFSAEILRVVQPRTLYLIDPWMAVRDESHTGAWYAVDQQHMDEISDAVQARFAEPIARGQVVVHRATSAAAGERLGPSTLDWVYIDGDHLYEAVRDDLQRFARAVRAGGLICGDDYGQGGWWQGGVKRAVDEAVAAGRFEVVTIRNGQFVLRLAALP